jgi:hypothetical protein
MRVRKSLDASFVCSDRTSSAPGMDSGDGAVLPPPVLHTATDRVGDDAHRHEVQDRRQVADGTATNDDDLMAVAQRKRDETERNEVRQRGRATNAA